MKMGRSLYYFHKLNVYVHGRIYIGKRKNVLIGERCSVNWGVVLQGFNDITIGNEVVLSVNCVVLDGKLDYDLLRRTGKRVHIPSFVHIGEIGRAHV
jgi:acetyltransferase-like isoleucine patch superfamily enzyme